MSEQTPASPIAFMRPTGRAWMRVAAGFALGVAVLWLASRAMGVRASEVHDVIWAAPRSVIAFNCVAVFALFSLSSLRWRSVMYPSVPLRFHEAYVVGIATYMFNAVLPARGGDMLRVHYLGTRTGVPRARILGAEIMDHWVDLCGPIPLALLLPLSGAAPRWVLRGAAVLIGFMLLLGAFMLAARLHRPRESSWLGRVMASLRLAYVGLGPRRLFTTALVLAPLPWLGETVTVAIFLRGMGVALSLPTVFSVLVAYKVGMVVPSPAGIGSVEVAGAGALVLVGVPAPTALGAMLLFHATQLLTGCLAAIVLLMIRGTELIAQRGTSSSGAGAL